MNSRGKPLQQVKATWDAFNGGNVQKRSGGCKEKKRKFHSLFFWGRSNFRPICPSKMLSWFSFRHLKNVYQDLAAYDLVKGSELQQFSDLLPEAEAMMIFSSPSSALF